MNSQRPDLLNLPAEKRGLIMSAPPKNASEQYKQSFIRWVVEPIDQQKEPQERSSGGGSHTRNSIDISDGGAK